MISLSKIGNLLVLAIKPGAGFQNLSTVPEHLAIVTTLIRVAASRAFPMLYCGDVPIPTSLVRCQVLCRDFCWLHTEAACRFYQFLT